MTIIKFPDNGLHDREQKIEDLIKRCPEMKGMVKRYPDAPAEILEQIVVYWEDLYSSNIEYKYHFQAKISKEYIKEIEIAVHAYQRQFLSNIGTLMGALVNTRIDLMMCRHHSGT